MTTTPPLLPQPDSYESYARLRGDPSIWLPALRVICARHGLSAGALYAERTGTHVVFRAGDGPWIKLFAPQWPQDHRSEAASLHALSAQRELPTPLPVAEGEIEGWPYLVLGHLEGRSLREVWSDLADEARDDLGTQIGRLLAVLHGVDAGALAQVVEPWPVVREQLLDACVAKHERSGATKPWLREIERYVTDLPPLDDPESQPVFLHADVTDDHVLVSERDGRWNVTGLIDFGDAMIGHRLYEFAAPAVFLTQRRPGPRRAMLRAYGFSQKELTPQLTRKLTAYVLLHRYARLPDILRLCPPPTPRTTVELEQALWGFV